MNAIPTEVALLRLLQLTSPSLPVGAYAYSQGQEWAVAAGWIHDEASLVVWLGEQLEHGIARVDLPVLARLCAAARQGDEVGLLRWSRTLIAMRETHELRTDDAARGRALARLLRDLGIDSAAPWVERAEVPFATAVAVAGTAWDLPADALLTTYAWGWLENQVLAAVKLVPLGQVAGQRVMLALAARIPAATTTALALADDEIGGTLPIVALASSLHETQYTRLFRS